MEKHEVSLWGREKKFGLYLRKMTSNINYWTGHLLCGVSVLLNSLMFWINSCIPYRSVSLTFPSFSGYFFGTCIGHQWTKLFKINWAVVNKYNRRIHGKDHKRWLKTSKMLLRDGFKLQNCDKALMNHYVQIIPDNIPSILQQACFPCHVRKLHTDSRAHCVCDNMPWLFFPILTHSLQSPD